MTDNQIAKVENRPAGDLATVMGVPPKQLMDYAINVANTLTQVLREKKLTRSFQKGGKEHVEAAGWQLAGALMGFTSSEGPAVELPDGSYEATMELRSVKTSELLAKGSARCGMDEPNWRSKPKYARRSMAFTRANGRVYSQNFRWLIELAGFAGTPTEEMEGLEQPEEPPHEGIFEAPLEQPKEPGPEHYNSQNSLHRTRLKAQLKVKKVPDSFFIFVSEEMAGLPMTMASIDIAILAARERLAADDAPGDPEA